MVIFHSYVSLPEGKESWIRVLGKPWKTQSSTSLEHVHVAIHASLGQHPLSGNPSVNKYVQCFYLPCQLQLQKQFFQDPGRTWLDCETQKQSGSENQVPITVPIIILWPLWKIVGIPDNVSWTPAQEVGQAVQPSSSVTMVEWLGSFFGGPPFWGNFHLDVNSHGFFVESMTIPFHIMKGIYQGC